MKWQRAIFLVVLLVAGCGEIKNSSRLVQPINTTLIAGVGDSIIEIASQESLPNVAGKADIFGRTRSTGKTYVTYLGLDQGRATFERYTIRLQSNATTMNSTPIVIPRASATTYAGSTNIGGVTQEGSFSGHAISSGVATTSAPPVVLPASGSETRIISDSRLRYYLDLRQSRNLVVEGHEIFVDEATPSSVKYEIKKLR